MNDSKEDVSDYTSRLYNHGWMSKRLEVLVHKIMTYYCSVFNGFRNEGSERKKKEERNIRK